MKVGRWKVRGSASKTTSTSYFGNNINSGYTIMASVKLSDIINKLNTGTTHLETLQSG